MLPNHREQEDKHWAKAYLLDPLTAPEPSQETGPGSSFYNPRRSLSVRTGHQVSTNPQKPNHDFNERRYPTPPHSVSPTTSDFHPSNPFSFAASGSTSPRSGWAPANTVLNRSSSIKSSTSSFGPQSPRATSSRPQSPISPHWEDSIHHYPQASSSRIGRSNTARVPRQRYSSNRPPPTQETQPWWNHQQGPQYATNTASTGGLRRASSLTARYPGDQTHRPLDMILQEQRTADMPVHLPPHKKPVTDLIDSLDATAIGGTYHHGGPYDATLANRNINKKYSPVEAVKESNMEALKATPQEFIQDSLTKHVPLQGTAIVPPGMSDFNGRPMEYQEGADLMREDSAPGGPYRRYEGIQYHSHDLKGKGEPGFTQDQRLKKQKAVQENHLGPSTNGSADIELQPQPARQRSVSSGAGPSGGNIAMASSSHTNKDLGRRNTTGRRFAEGLRRRFSSIRRKKATNHADDA